MTVDLNSLKIFAQIVEAAGWFMIFQLTETTSRRQASLAPNEAFCLTNWASQKIGLC
jgi:hypothetical protein